VTQVFQFFNPHYRQTEVIDTKVYYLVLKLDPKESSLRSMEQYYRYQLRNLQLPMRYHHL